MRPPRTPKGAPEARYSLAPVAARLGELLGAPVELADRHGRRVAPRPSWPAWPMARWRCWRTCASTPGRRAKDDAERGAFADQLASLADVFVSDGFGVVHRKQASVYDVAQRLPHATGTLVTTEVDVLRRLTVNPERPVRRGPRRGEGERQARPSSTNLLQTADRLLVGGGMVFTFLAAQGHEVGKSLLEADQIDVVTGYLSDAKARGVEIVLPVDIVAATSFSADAEHQVVPADGIPADRMGLDIGPESASLFGAKLADARTVFWNGPMGVVRDGALRRRHPRAGRRAAGSRRRAVR